MTHEQALQRLGLQRGADAEAVRKAYLQSIKRHSPERDPEGFKQVRAAYELLKSGLFSLAPARVEDAPHDDVDALPQAAPQIGLANATTARVDPLATYSERVWSSESAVEAEALARAAVENLGSAESYSLLIDTLDYVDRSDEVPAVAREAISRGYQNRFVQVLAERCPQALGDDELDAWRVRVQDRLDDGWADLALLYIQRGRSESVRELIDLALKQTREDPFAPRVSTWRLTTLVLAFLERGEHELAGRVLHAAETALGPDERLDAVTAARRQLARELARVASRLPPELTTLMASSASAHDPRHADADLMLFARRRKRDARKALKLFKREAPILLECYGAALRLETSHGFLLESDNKWALSGMAFAGVFVVIRVLVIPAWFSDAADKPAPAPTEADLAANAGRGNPDWLRFMCHDAPRDLCDAAWKVHAAGDCHSLYYALAALEVVQEAHSADVTLSSNRASIVRKLRERGEQICKFKQRGRLRP